MIEHPLLSVDALYKAFPLRRSLGDALRGRPQRRVRAAHNVTFSVRVGESVGLVGESGCGKTTLGRLVLGLLSPDDGVISFSGRDIGSANPAERRALRQRMQLVFQDPYTSLNPRMRVGEALAEPIRVHAIVPPAKVTAEVTRLLDRVGLPLDVARRYPAELSGGQRQRVGIARALSLRPRLLIADEALSGLDVSVRAQVLNLFDDLRLDLGLSLLFISHDLGVVEYLCDTVAVMYLGSMVEYGPTDRVFAASGHPYTRALMRAVPLPNPASISHDRAPPLTGEPPSPIDPPSGCPFRTRCPEAKPICTTEPRRLLLDRGHWAACHFALDIASQPPIRQSA